jgi:hypothetical protein
MRRSAARGTRASSCGTWTADTATVGEGDEVRGARIVEITQNAVLLRNAQGRLRRLTGGSR